MVLIWGMDVENGSEGGGKLICKVSDALEAGFVWRGGARLSLLKLSENLIYINL